MSKFCVKRPYTVLVGVVMVLVLGFISFTRITTDLLPTISLPYVVAVATYPGATPERVESTVTELLERSLGTVNGVENVTSTSSENYSMVMLEFSEGTNMDSAMVKLSTAAEQLGDALPEEVGTPLLMEISPDMLPTMMVSLDYDGKDIKELSQFAEDTLIPYLERQEGVASVTATGITVEQVEIQLDQVKIDNVNDRILASMDGTFAEAKEKLDEQESQLASAKSQISSGQAQLEGQQNSTYDELASFSQMLDSAMASAASYEAQLNGLKTSQAALDAEKKAYNEQVVPAYDQLNQMLAQLGSMSPVPLEKELSVSAILEDESQATYQQIVGLIDQLLLMDPDNEQYQALKQSFTWENLNTMEQAVTVRIPQIDTELANLNTEIAAAQALLDQVNQQMAEAKANYAQVEKGKLSAAAAFGAASAQLSAGEAQITSGQAQLDAAREQYESARETAMKSANVDALVDKTTLSQLLYAQNFEMPAGYIREGESQTMLRVGKEFESLEELENVLLLHMEGVGDIRLKDVANLAVTDNSGDSYAKINNNDAVMLSMMKASTAGTSDVSRTLNDAIEELQEEYEGLHFVVMMDQGEYIGLIIRSVLQNLIFGAILAIIVLALFLKDVKPTVVVAFSIPLSVLFAIVLMYFSDVTLNIISLSGLALGVGMLVDNSIVVIENIYRLRSEGVPAPKAAVLGAKQVSGAIFASTLTTICVFLPIVFTEGLTRELFTDMGLTIAYSLLASLVVALTFVPAMSSTVLRRSRQKAHPLFDRVMIGYEKALRFCLRWKVVPLTLSVGLLVVAAYGAGRMGMELIPSMSTDSISVSVSMNEETDQDTIYRQADELVEEIGQIEGVETVGVMSGGGTVSMASMTGGASSGEKQTQFTYYALLDEEHANDGDAIAREIEALGEGKEERYEMSAASSGMDMSALGGSGMQIDIQGEDLDTLLSVSEDVMDILGQVKGFEEITNGQDEDDIGLRLALDKDAAMRNGLTVAQIFSELSTKLQDTASVATMTLSGNEYEVVVVDETNRLTAGNLLEYTFDTTTRDEEGNEVQEEHKLKEFASTEEANSIASISRDNQARHMTVSAQTMDGYNTTLLSREVSDLLEDYRAPEGYTVEIAGEVVNIQDTMIDLVEMIALAIVFIYMIMVAQFQSLLSPFIVLFTIPLAFTGGLLAIWFTGQTLSMVAMIGFLVLAGVVVNNGIVFVDYVNQLRLAGREKRDALVETGITRMRPILMTALTTILAMSTLAFDREMTAAMSRGMATVTIGGLTYATLMTLFIVPVLYDIFFRRKLKVIDVEADTELDEENIVLAIDQSVQQAQGEPAPEGRELPLPSEEELELSDADSEPLDED